MAYPIYSPVWEALGNVGIPTHSQNREVIKKYKKIWLIYKSVV